MSCLACWWCYNAEAPRRVRYAAPAPSRSALVETPERGAMMPTLRRLKQWLGIIERILTILRLLGILR